MSMRRSSLDISVRNPVKDSKCITYEIAIQTSNPAFTLRSSTTGRKHNDFCWLRKTLKKHHPLFKPPELPVKKSIKQCDNQFLVQRMRELEDWLYCIMAVSLYLSDSTLHLFLQTDLSCRQIQQYLDGKLSEDVITRGRHNCQCAVIADSISTVKEKEMGEDTTRSMSKELAKKLSQIDIPNHYTYMSGQMNKHCRHSLPIVDGNSTPSLPVMDDNSRHSLLMIDDESRPSLLVINDNSRPSLPVMDDNFRYNQSTGHVIKKSEEMVYKSGGGLGSKHVLNQSEKSTDNSGTSLPTNHVTQNVTMDHGKGKQHRVKFETFDRQNFSIQASDK